MEGPVRLSAKASSAHLRKNVNTFSLQSLRDSRDYFCFAKSRETKPHLNPYQEKRPTDGRSFFLEGPVRLELTTPCLKGRCSNQLSYGPARTL